MPLLFACGINRFSHDGAHLIWYGIQVKRKYESVSISFSLYYTCEPLNFKTIQIVEVNTNVSVFELSFSGFALEDSSLLLTALTKLKQSYRPVSKTMREEKSPMERQEKEKVCQYRIHVVH